MWKKSFWKVLLLLAVAVLIFSASIANRVVQSEWQKKESPYPIAYQHMGAKLLTKFAGERSYDGTLVRLFHYFQSLLTQSAFRHIPVSDDERVLWKLWLDYQFLYHAKHGPSDDSFVDQLVLYFDALDRGNMRASFAGEYERYEYMYRLANAFYMQSTNYKGNRVDLMKEKQHILLRLSSLEAHLPYDKYVNSGHTVWRKSLPLRWRIATYNAAVDVLFDAKSNRITCDVNAIRLLRHTAADLKTARHFYASMARTNSTQMMMRHAEKVRTISFPKFDALLAKECRT